MKCLAAIVMLVGWAGGLVVCWAELGAKPVSAAEASEAGSNLAAGLESITTGELKEYAKVLSDDSMEGRDAGSRGGQAASLYLMKQFKALKLKPAGDDETYFQPFGNLRNVLGMIEGSDPKLKKQVILICAHYDHVGFGTWRTSLGPLGYIHNGADDNASGVAGLLEIAGAFAAQTTAPKRTILFALWDGEEHGLLGSKNWAARPTVPLDRVMLAINMDMIGRMRNDKIEILGSRSAAGLRELVSRNNARIGLDIDFTWEMQENSDHYPFFARRIPIVMPFTYKHEDYHRPSDDVEKLNVEGMRRVSQLAYRVAYELAESPKRLEFRAASMYESPATRVQKEQPLANPPARLGVSWDNQTKDGKGLLVSSIMAGSVAQQAGIVSGDRIIELNGKQVSDEDQFRIDLLASPRKAKVTIERPKPAKPDFATDKRPNKSETERKTFEVQLVGAPVRVGLSWREDEASPGTVYLVQVIPGSAADLAGMRVGDRVYEIGGKPFKDSDAFHDAIKTLPSPMEILIERRGRLELLKLNVPPATSEGQAVEKVD